MINEEIVTEFIAFYKVTVRQNDGSTRYMIFKTAKDNSEEVFKHPVLQIAKEQSLESEDDPIENVELIWKGSTYNLVDPFQKDMSDLCNFGMIGKMLGDDLQTVSSITDERIEAIEFIADAIKEKAERVRIFLTCLRGCTGEVNEGSPVMVDDIPASQ